MSGWKRLMAISAVVVAAMASTAAPTSAAGPTTRWVDNDGHAGPAGCNSSAHASTTIQHAVDASHRGDTVKVCPGTYLKQVTIQGHRDGLTLESSRKWGATIKAPTSLEAAGPYGFTVLVLIDRTDYVTVRGFKVVTRTQAPCDIVGVRGLTAIASKQTAIRGNRLFAPGTSTDPGSCYQLNGIVAIDSFSLTGLHARASSATIGFNEVRDAVNFSIGVEADREPVRADIVHELRACLFGQRPTVTAAMVPRRPSSAGPSASAVAACPGDDRGRRRPGCDVGTHRRAGLLHRDRGRQWPHAGARQWPHLHPRQHTSAVCPLASS